jgi:putative chitobiose transport system permease protein
VGTPIAPLVPIRQADVRARRAVIRTAVHVALVVLALSMLLPYYWMFINSLKGPQGFTTDPYSLLPQSLSLASFDYVWTTGRVSVYLKNSFLYAAIVLGAQLLINSLAAYAFARVEFPGRDALFMTVLATMMLPYSVLLIPSYLIVWQIGLANTLPGVVVPGFASAFGIFMLRQFFLNIPRDLEDAARIDGCSRFRIYWNIVVPLAKPALITLGVFIFIGEWSSFVWPLVVINDWRLYPITVGIALFRLEQGMYWDRTFAASVFASAPLILLFLVGQRYIIGGINLTGLKG